MGRYIGNSITVTGANPAIKRAFLVSGRREPQFMRAKKWGCASGTTGGICMRVMSVFPMYSERGHHVNKQPLFFGAVFAFIESDSNAR